MVIARTLTGSLSHRVLSEDATASESARYRREAVSCYVCGTSESQPVLTAGDDYTGKPGTFTFVQCRSCGLVYQNPRLSIEDVVPFYDDNYISHRRDFNFGWLTRLVRNAFAAHDRRKIAIVDTVHKLSSDDALLDVGCARATFLLEAQRRFGCRIHGVDFKDMSSNPGFTTMNFHHGLFYEQDFTDQRFDVITMWHFLEHCYDPLRSLRTARDLLRPKGHLIIEVPRLDSFSSKLFGQYWPGVQAPQHTMLLSRRCFVELLRRAGLRVVSYKAWGSFPAFFYFYLGVAFTLSRGKGFDPQKHLASYFAGQILLSPVMAAYKMLNLCMQTAIVVPEKS